MTTDLAFVRPNFSRQGPHDVVILTHLWQTYFPPILPLLWWRQSKSLREGYYVNFKRRCIINSSAMLAAFALALFSTSSLAILFRCGLSGSTHFSPAHLQAKDVITFNVDLYQTLPPGYVVLSKLTVGAGNQIMFDVLITPPDTVAMFPDYQPDVVLPPEPLAVGTFGPIPVGQYATTTSVRVFDAVNGLHKPCADTTGTLIVYADDGLSPVIEYYYALLDHYFITQFKDEIAALDAGVHPGWVRTGQSFFAYRPAQGAGQPVYRYYGLPSAGLDTHFFTLGFNEGDLMFLIAHASAWEPESGDAFDLDFPSVVVGDIVVPGSCKQGEVPVYRLWNQRVDSNHRYTTDPAIKAQMIAKGYVAEGYGPDAIMMCAFTRQVP